MKTNAPKVILAFLIASVIVFFSVVLIKRKDSVRVVPTQEKKLIQKSGEASQPISKNNPAAKDQEETDTTITFYFKDLSKEYNYKVINRYVGDTAIKTIKIYNKKDSLIQTIHPKMECQTMLYYDKDKSLKHCRSYLSGKNVNAEVSDDYYGEIVVADLNFDGLEDFATPVDHGADNGPHYAFYIQDSSKRFHYNPYLTDEVMWFPDEINDTAKTFTNSINIGVYGVSYTTYKYYPAKKKWRIIKRHEVSAND